MAETDTTQQSQAATVVNDKPPFLIAQIAAFLVWLETLVTTVSSLMLTFVAVLTVASALNGGRLLDTNAFLNAAYAWCQGIGIEGQLSGMAFNAVRAGRTGKGTQAFWFWVLTLLLAGASFMAAGAVNYQESFHVPFTQSLAHVGINQELWVWVRAGVLITLLVLAAAMRYQQPVQESLADRLRKLQEQAAMNQARAELLGQGLRGLRQAVGGNKDKDKAEPPAPLG